MNLRVHAEAEKELLKGATWYDERQSGLGEQFIDEYQSAILRILATPRSYARISSARSRRNVRRCPLKRFPYFVAYELRDDLILVLAVAHAKRRPNYWIRRS